MWPRHFLRPATLDCLFLILDFDIQTSFSRFELFFLLFLSLFSTFFLQPNFVLVSFAIASIVRGGGGGYTTDGLSACKDRFEWLCRKLNLAARGQRNEGSARSIRTGKLAVQVYLVFTFRPNFSFRVKGVLPCARGHSDMSASP